jgi:hypothetical protein
MSGYEITCVNKNARGFIVRIGGNGWSLGTHEAIIKIISKQIQLMICVNDEYVEIGVRGKGFDAYLALEPDASPLRDLDFPCCWG